MKLTQQSIQLVDPATPNEWLAQFRKVERAYRTCYKSEGKQTEDSYLEFIPNHINHESPLEHCCISVIINCSRAIAQEFLRHRLVSPSMESTRWIDYFKKYGGSVDFVEPSDFSKFTDEQREAYLDAMKSSEEHYNRLRDLGLKAQRARDAFALGLRCEIFASANVRTWRHVFRERYFNEAAHPDIRALFGQLYEKLLYAAPVFFSDLKTLNASD